MADRYLGLISGTSMDGIDAAVLELGDAQPRVVGAMTRPYSADLRQRLGTVVHGGVASLDDVGQIDTLIGREFAAAALEVLERTGLAPTSIRAIGSHGQTIRHTPGGSAAFTMQVGDPNVIAETTGITTVADFRRRDLAAGGQGAPLVPAFHAAVFGSASERRVALNLGGIANVTLLDAAGASAGWDTGPANCLLDLWIERHQGLARDDAGQWAASGTVDDALLALLLDDPYFPLPPPKSTGRELFNLPWLERKGGERLRALPPVDVQATLAELSAITVAQAVARIDGPVAEVIACGGGVRNRHLMQRLRAHLAPRRLSAADAHGIDPDFVEAAAFAWLAARRLDGLPGNAPGATGASGPRVLGAIYPGAAG